MGISIAPGGGFSEQLSQVQNNNSTSKVESSISKLQNGNASDKELMDACKGFEEYLIEQVIKSTKNAMLSEKDEDNEYMNYFGDNLYQEYAKMISENANLGIAQMLYDNMKLNQGTQAAGTTQTTANTNDN